MATNVFELFAGVVIFTYVSSASMVGLSGLNEREYESKLDRE